MTAAVFDTQRNAWRQLTPRQRQVMDGLRRGLSYKLIARELGVSPWTVHDHLRRLYAQLGVRGRIEAVVLSMALDEPVQLSERAGRWRRAIERQLAA